jgi:hypothetical protein
MVAAIVFLAIDHVSFVTASPSPSTEAGALLTPPRRRARRTPAR